MGGYAPRSASGSIRKRNSAAPTSPFTASARCRSAKNGAEFAAALRGVKARRAGWLQFQMRTISIWVSPPNQTPQKPPMKRLAPALLSLSLGAFAQDKTDFAIAIKDHKF